MIYEPFFKNLENPFKNVSKIVMFELPTRVGCF